MFNEQEMASLFIKRVNDVLLSLNDYDYEIVLVNDGSNDETLEILKKEQEINNKIVIVNLTRNWGHESALFAGLKVAKGDAVIPMDADLQDPPEIIPDMIKLWEEGYDVVNARRKSRKEDTLFKRKSAALFYKWANKISRGVKIPQNVANYRLISRRALDEVLALEETSRVFRIEVPFVGFKVGEVYFSRPKREKGKSKYKLSSMFSLAISSTVSLTNRPLEWSIHLTILIGLLFVISTFTQIGFLLVYLITNYLLISEFWNGIWLICNVMLLLTTIILFVLAVLSQYSGRSLDEVRKRPAVIIKEIMRK
jgi:glycosyltransferase involved in cell wall biosynthesis